MFTGGGLYESESGCLADELDGDDQGPSRCDATRPNERGGFRALRKVFQSFYNDNAFPERLRHRVDERTVGMAVLVHTSTASARLGRVLRSWVLDQGAKSVRKFHVGRCNHPLTTNAANLLDFGQRMAGYWKSACLTEKSLRRGGIVVGSSDQAAPVLGSRRVPSLAAAGAACAAILAYVVLRYGDAVALFFFLDDFWVLRDAHRVQASGGWALPQLFRPSHGGLMLYRPLTQLGYFYLLRQLFGLDAGAYHAFQVLLFGLNACLVVGIVRCLTASWGWGLAGGLLYAVAPGHALAVYWLAAATMTGTATLVLSALLWWLAAPRRWRAAGAGVLQLAALGASEHAVALPLLLLWFALLGPERLSLRSALREVVPVAAVTGLYLGVKGVYFLYAGGPWGGYALTGRAGLWLTNLGRYALACVNLLMLHVDARQAASGVGAGLLAALGLAVVAARRWPGAWSLPALGLATFVTALLPVLPLANHYYDFFVGVAALGAALVLVGLCRALPRGHLLAAALVATVLIVDRATCGRAAEAGTAMRLMRLASADGRDVLRRLARTAALAPAGTPIRVPDSPHNKLMIDFGQANVVFFDPPIPVVYGGRPPAAGTVVVLPLLPAAADVPVPGADARWDWLRRAAAAAHAAWAGGCR